MAEVRRATVRTMRIRGGALLEAVVTDGARELSLTFFAKRAGALRPHEERLRPGTARHVHRDRPAVPRSGPAHPSRLPAGRHRRGRRGRSAGRGEPADPGLPGLGGAAHLADPAGGAHRARPADGRRTSPTRCRTEIRDPAGLPTLLEALQLVHEPFTDDDWHRGRRRLRYEEAFVLQAALARRRVEAAARPGVARPGATGGLLDDVRRTAAVHAHGGPARGRCRDRRGPRGGPPHAATAPGRGRIGQDGGRAAGDAPGGGRGRPGGAARADRGARRPAPAHAARAARGAGAGGHARRGRAGHAGGAAHRLAAGRGSGARRCSTRPRARQGSWWARTRCSASGSSSPTSAWSWSTSSTGSGSSSATRCARAADPTTPCRTCW